jgi:hypothetical protein
MNKANVDKMIKEANTVKVCNSYDSLSHYKELIVSKDNNA